MLESTIINGKIELKSGLHIGGNKDTMQIGGIDNPVVKNSLTNMPYIPGSSLKGKMRFLLEHYYDLVSDGSIPKVDQRGNAKWETNKIAVIFGHLEHNKVSTKPTRIIFTDSNVIGAFDEQGQFVSDKEALKEKMLASFVEAKTEVAINRLTGTAQNGALRVIERVPAGVVFDFRIVLKCYDELADEEHLEIVKKGLKLLENDALGGSGSRGSGRIKFHDLTINGAPLDLSTVEL
ncbi:MAG: type III-A CRISPR-associated RAMP protein Csm3 [Candidatus Cloacimonadota bacterium]